MGVVINLYRNQNNDTVAILMAADADQEPAG